MTENHASSQQKPDRLLRIALGANAAFSALSALVLMGLTEAVAGFTGLAADQIFTVGIDLALFAGFLVFLLSRSDLGAPRYQAATILVIALDALWVVGSAAALMGALPLTGGGKIVIGVVALVVADVAFFQFLGWRRLRRGQRRDATLDEPVAVTS